MNYCIRYITSWQEGITTRLPLNAAFVDSGVYLELMQNAGGQWIPKGDVSKWVKRYGHVNYAKKGTYYIEYKVECNDDDPNLMPDYDGWTVQTAPLAVWVQEGDTGDFVALPEQAIRRRVEVYEPVWLDDIRSYHYDIFPIVTQTLERYNDLYWELNYRTDFQRLGLERRMIMTQRYVSTWVPPVGVILSYRGMPAKEMQRMIKDKFFIVEGYNFTQGMVIDFIANFKKVEQLQQLSIVEVKGEYPLWKETASYREGDIVEYCGKNWRCQTEITIDPNRLTQSQVILPDGDKTWDKQLDDGSSSQPYWKLVSVIRVVRNKFEYGRIVRDPEFWKVTDDPNGPKDLGEFINSITMDDEDGEGVMSIAEHTPMVDGQGFIFGFDWEDVLVKRDPPIVIQEVGGEWEIDEPLTDGNPWDETVDPEQGIEEDGEAGHILIERRRG